MGTLFGTTIRADDPFFRYTTEDRVILTQAAQLRLSTESAALWTEPGYGDALSTVLQSGLSFSELARIEDRAKGELGKDERIDEVTATATISGRAGSIGVKLAMVIKPVGLPAFPLTILYREGNSEVVERY